MNTIINHVWRLLLLLCCTTHILPLPVSAFELGPPPTFPDDVSRLQVPDLAAERGRWVDKETGGFSVDVQNREESRIFYNSTYLASEGVTMNWTGNHAACDEGNTAQDFRDAVLLRVNYFRTMAGVPADVAFSLDYSNKNQQGALMMSANASLSHSPPMSWICYTADGAEAAENSNIALGVSSWNAVTGYMQDPGSSNHAVGHRRWILYPQTQTMGTGDVPYANGFLAANTLWVFDPNIFGPRPSTREEFVAWPPPGYVPYQVVFARWSFSYEKADFSTASVSMVSDGVDAAIALEPLETGFGENTLVWILIGMDDADAWPQPSEDTTYTVTISDVLIEDSPQSFTYDVIIFDPATEGLPIPSNHFTGIQITGTSSNIMSNIVAGDTVQFTVEARVVDQQAPPVNYRFFLRAGYGEPNWGGNRWTIVQEYSESNTVSVLFDTPGIYFLIGQIEYPGETWQFGDPQAGFPVEVWPAQ